VEFVSIFQIVPSSHLPLITAGKRCKDTETGESFICLGYAKNNFTTIYKTSLSLMQEPDSQIIGLLISNESTTQLQKLFNINKLIEVRGADESEIFDHVSEPEKNALMKEMGQQSIYMNP
jgi:hypothetical protein